jgi:hypothetical protein
MVWASLNRDDMISRVAPRSICSAARRDVVTAMEFPWSNIPNRRYLQGFSRAVESGGGHGLASTGEEKPGAPATSAPAMGWPPNR